MAGKGPVSKRDEPDEASEWTPLVYVMNGVEVVAKGPWWAQKRKPGKGKLTPPKESTS